MKLYEAKNHLLIHSKSLVPSNHNHMAAHIIICLEGNIKVTSNDKSYLCRGVMIPSGVPHEIDTMENAVLVFLYDNTTDVAMQIHYIKEIADNTSEKIIDLYTNFEDGNINYYMFEEQVLNEVGITNKKQLVIDERIIDAMKYVQDNISDKITCQNTADAVFLSQGRFSHLFKENIGMTFASYVIYQRIMYAFTQIYQGVSITEAALAAGFSSSAHFADINRRVFGLSASDIIKELDFIKV